jgi:cobalamin biosynthesis Mg chelatase CobN
MVNTCGHPFVRRSVSVLDQFRTAEEQVAKRLRELKPLVAEYHELEQVAQRLGLSVSNDAPAPDTRPPTSTKPARRRRRAAKAAARSAASKRDGSADTGTAKTSVAATQARGGRSPQSSAGNGRAGASRTSRRQQDVLRLVKQRPGITVSEIAKELGVDATGLYRPVHKLEQDGAIIKRGVALTPTSD